MVKTEGRGRNKNGATIVTSIRDALVADRRLMIRELAELFDMGCGAIHCILMEILQMTKIYNSELYIVLILCACCKWYLINVFTNVGQGQFKVMLQDFFFNSYYRG